MESESTQVKDDLMKRLYAAPTELLAKLAEAVESKKYAVTIHMKKGNLPGDLKHYYKRVDYPAEDFIPSLKHVAGVFAEQVKKIVKWT